MNNLALSSPNFKNYNQLKLKLLPRSITKERKIWAYRSEWPLPVTFLLEITYCQESQTHLDKGKLFFV